MRLVVLGGGESGVGTAILGKQKGYDVFVSDFGKIKDNYKEVLNHNAIAWEEETHTESLILNADVVMKSPGIPDKSPIVKKLSGLMYGEVGAFSAGAGHGALFWFSVQLKAVTQPLSAE